MATHSSILAWEIPWADEPGGLQSMALQKSWIRLSNLRTVACIRAKISMQEYTKFYHLISSIIHSYNIMHFIGFLVGSSGKQLAS